MRFTVALLLLACLITHANGSIIDVNNLVPARASATVEPLAFGFGRGQAFQIGQTGSLDRISVSVSNPRLEQGDMTVIVFELLGNETNGSQISSVASASTTLNGYAAAAIYDFHFTTLNFTAGKKLAFALYGPLVKLEFGDAGPPNSTPIYVYEFYKIGFGSSGPAVFATYITPVPEPASVFMTGIACVALAVRFKKPH